MRHAAGRDFQSRVMGDSASTGTGSYAATYFMGLSTKTAAPVDGDTTLTGEYTAGTLARKAASYSHTLGSASYVLSATFTSDVSTTPASYGLFNAATGGTMPFSGQIPNPAPLVSGDQEVVTDTIAI